MALVALLLAASSSSRSPTSGHKHCHAQHELTSSPMLECSFSLLQTSPYLHPSSRPEGGLPQYLSWLHCFWSLLLSLTPSPK